MSITASGAARAASFTEADVDHFPRGLRDVAIRAFRSPLLTSDFLLTFADANREAARHVAPHFMVRSHYERLADMAAAAAPFHAHVPLPGPLQPAVTVRDLREAARTLGAYGPAGSTTTAALLRGMADALEGRRA